MTSTPLPNEEENDYVIMQVDSQRYRFLTIILLLLFLLGLQYDSDLYNELTKYPCRMMEDMLAKAWAQIKWEDDGANYRPQTRQQKDYMRDQRVDRRLDDR